MAVSGTPGVSSSAFDRRPDLRAGRAAVQGGGREPPVPSTSRGALGHPQRFWLCAFPA